MNILVTVEFTFTILLLAATIANLTDVGFLWFLLHYFMIVPARWNNLWKFLWWLCYAYSKSFIFYELWNIWNVEFLELPALIVSCCFILFHCHFSAVSYWMFPSLDAGGSCLKMAVFLRVFWYLLTSIMMLLNMHLSSSSNDFLMMRSISVFVFWMSTCNLLMNYYYPKITGTGTYFISSLTADLKMTLIWCKILPPSQLYRLI